MTRSSVRVRHYDNEIIRRASELCRVCAARYRPS